MTAPIGTLRIDLGVDTREFASGLAEAQQGLAKFAGEVAAKFKELEAVIRKVAIGLSAGITAPFAAMVAVSGRGAGGFEAAMNRVQAALRGLSADQLKKLSDQARLLGPDVGKSAVEAADGIEMLALAGMSAEAILGGGLASTLKLAAANNGELAASAALVSDVMVQFGKISSELAPIVDKVTGALDASKLSFDDYRLAIGQAGGVAGGAAGVSFEDFNAAIAATSPLFASGSDAGTSFKTFITSLTPKTKEAAETMAALGLSFFDATGQMKGLAEISQELQDALGNLSDRSRTAALTKIFGTDAMRTAIGLMKQGKAGFEDLQRTIGRADAGEKLAIQMQGLEAATNRLKAAFEGLKISIGETGLLNFLTSLTTGFSGMVRGISEANPTLLKIGVVLWGVAAAIGPLTLALLTLGKLAVPLAIGRLGLLGTTLAVLINPLGALAGLLVKLAIYFTGATSALTLFATTLGRFLGPIGLAITAITLLYLWTNRTTQANLGLQKSSSVAEAALSKQTEQSLLLAQATGKAREELLAKMRADRAAAILALQSAKADLAAAMATRQRIAALADLNRQRMQVAANDPRLMPAAGPQVAQERMEQADADARKATENLTNFTKAVEGYNASIASAATPGIVDMEFGGEDAGQTKKDKEDEVARLALRREELKLYQALDVARTRGDIEEQHRLENLIDLKRREADYEDAGLKAADAKIAAARDMRELQDAIAFANAKEVALSEDDLDLQLAEIRGDQVMIELLRQKDELHERTQMWRERGIPLIEAEKRAASDLVHLEAARLEMRERMNREMELDRSAALSRLRGDSEGRVRAAERASEMERRSRDYEERYKLNPSEARDKAKLELDEEERARLQGDFRDTFKAGVRAALDGDFKSFFKNWWTERLTRSLEDALNNVADLLFKLVGGAFQQGAPASGGGGGFLGAIGKLLGLGGGLNVGALNTTVATNSDWLAGNMGWKAPGFATGGSFEVGGRSGIDANLVQFRATKGEIVNIKRPGNDNGSSRVMVVPSPYFDVVVDNRAATVAAPMARAGAVTGSATAQASIYRRAGRQLP